MELTRMGCLAAVAWAIAGAAIAQTGPTVGDFSVAITGTPSQVIPPAGRATRSQIILQVQGAAAVACRPDGVPGFGGGSIVLKGDSTTPAAGGSATLTGAAADPRGWQCVAYPPGGTATSILTAKVFP